MLRANHTTKPSIFRSGAVNDCGMNSALPFTVAGVAAEERNKWDSKNNRYSDEVAETGIAVVQDAVDENGEIFQQNPIMVWVPVDNLTKSVADKQFKFNTKVTFKDLGGYYSRKKHAWMWHATDVALWKEDK